MTENAPENSLESVVLQLDNGKKMSFSGRQFAGGSWFDEETGVLTRQNLYLTEEGEHVYSIVSGSGQNRERRAYQVTLEGESCTIFDGHTQISLDLNMLMMAVRALTGLDQVDAPTLEVVEEILRAANC